MPPMSSESLRRLLDYSRSKSEVCWRAADKRFSCTLVSTLLTPVGLDQIEKQLLEGVPVYFHLNERWEFEINARVKEVLVIQMLIPQPSQRVLGEWEIEVELHARPTEEEFHEEFHDKCDIWGRSVSFGITFQTKKGTLVKHFGHDRDSGAVCPSPSLHTNLFSRLLMTHIFLKSVV